MSEGWAAITLILGLAFGATTAMVISDLIWKAETVERGLAIYCPQNGQWAWVGECGDE